MVHEHPADEFHLFFDRPYSPEFLFTENVVPHVIAPPTRHPLLWKLWFDYQIPRHLRKHKIDVFYSPDGYASLRTDVPQVMVSHDLAFEHFDDHIYLSHRNFMRKHSPKYHQKAKHIIAVSEATKQDIVKTYGIDAAKISVAGNATDFKPNRAKKHSITKGKPYFIYIGSLNPRKNIIRLIEAFEQYKETEQNDTQLVLVGRLAWKSEDIAKAIALSPYKQEILHLSDVEGDPTALISQGKALVYPSLFEGFGIPILEGFACEVPVITSNCSSMAEVAGDAALLIDPLNTTSIANAMRRIDNEPDFVKDLVKKGSTRNTLYNWDNTAKMTYDALQKAAFS